MLRGGWLNYPELEQRLLHHYNRNKIRKISGSEVNSAS